MADCGELADRVRDLVSRLELQVGEEVAERKMFGGLCFTLNGKMLVGLAKDGRIVVRLSSSELDQAIAAGRAAAMDFTGKPMRNFAYVSAPEVQRPGALASWIEQSARYVRENMLGTKNSAR